MTNTFRELNVGDTFDFVNDDNRFYNSFYERCTKVSPRCYTWVSTLTGATLQSRVGTVNVHVFHVTREKKGAIL